MSELLEKILSKDNMNGAYKRVCANKGAGGIDWVTVEELGDYIKENWDGIRNQIRRREYKPQPVRRVEISKPNGGVRKLGIPVEVSNYLKVLWTKAMVLSVKEKAVKNCQVRIKEMNDQVNH